MMFLAGNLGTFIHAATERHARCPEHGHIIHVKGDAAQVSPDATAALDRGGLVIGPASPNADDHDHDHCQLCPASRKRVLASAGIGIPVAHVTEVRWHGVGDRDPQPRAAIYALAPKTSPPA